MVELRLSTIVRKQRETFVKCKIVSQNIEKFSQTIDVLCQTNDTLPVIIILKYKVSIVRKKSY